MGVDAPDAVARLPIQHDQLVPVARHAHRLGLDEETQSIAADLLHQPDDQVVDHSRILDAAPHPVEPILAGGGSPA